MKIVALDVHSECSQMTVASEETGEAWEIKRRSGPEWKPGAEAAERGPEGAEEDRRRADAGRCRPNHDPTKAHALRGGDDFVLALVLYRCR